MSPRTWLRSLLGRQPASRPTATKLATEVERFRLLGEEHRGRAGLICRSHSQKLFGMSGRSAKTCIADPINISSFSSMHRAILIVPGTSTTSSNSGACSGRAGECLASRFCRLCAVARQRMRFGFSDSFSPDGRYESLEM